LTILNVADLYGEQHEVSWNPVTAECHKPHRGPIAKKQLQQHVFQPLENPNARNLPLARVSCRLDRLQLRDQQT
jgi:hypothetical protein